MNYDEFAFFNQQLAGMLKSGIPLEGALRQLTRGMRNRRIRGELELLEADLQSGIPLATALEKRNLPDLYLAVLRAGSQSGDLPGILILLGDYYSRLHTITTRLKGLMVYPAIVLTVSLFLSLVLSFIYLGFIDQTTGVFFTPPSRGGAAELMFWVPPAILFITLGILLFSITYPRVRHWLRWRVPGAREASIAQSASTLSILLSSGTTFGTALELLEKAEMNAAAAGDFKRWRTALEQGKTRFADMAILNRAFPPLFVWIVAQSGENLAEGFKRAAEIFNDRASTRTDMLLHAALPLAVLVIGMFILGQMVSVAGIVTKMINVL